MRRAERESDRTAETGKVISLPRLGGLHHPLLYVKI
jgi:hypothetical protein